VIGLPDGYLGTAVRPARIMTVTSTTVRATRPPRPSPATSSFPLGAGESPVEAVDAAFERIDRDGRAGIWIELLDRELVRRRAAEVEARLATGADLRLAGRTVAVKGNIDVAGLRTTAACRSYGKVAIESAEAVRHLEAAGAIVLGVTNLDQFATGLVGTRSPYGICPNAHWPELISGGSSSGSAVAVAARHVDIALGTDTAGSGRVPAAANGIIGLKPTRGRIATAGIVPACRSFDCVSIFARDLELAAVAASVAAGEATGQHETGRPSSAPIGSPRSLSTHAGSLRLVIPSRDDLVEGFDHDPDGAVRFDTAVACLGGATGTMPGTVALAPFLAIGRLLYEGAFVAERYEAVGAFVDAHPDDVDPIVRQIVQAAGRIPAWQLVRDQALLEQLRTATDATWQIADVLVVPSVPRIPTVDEVLAEPVAVNSMLGTYTNFVNLLDLCALTVPVGPAPVDGPPTSLTFIAPAGHDADLVALAAALNG